MRTWQKQGTCPHSMTYALIQWQPSDWNRLASIFSLVNCSITQWFNENFTSIWMRQNPRPPLRASSGGAFESWQYILVTFKLYYIIFTVNKFLKRNYWSLFFVRRSEPIDILSPSGLAPNTKLDQCVIQPSSVMPILCSASCCSLHRYVCPSSYPVVARVYKIVWLS